MRILTLIALRTLSVICVLLALVSAVQLAQGAYAVFMVQKEFPDVSPLKLGGLHGQLIGSPILLISLFSAIAFGLWRFASRFCTKNLPER